MKKETRKTNIADDVEYLRDIIVVVRLMKKKKLKYDKKRVVKLLKNWIDELLTGNL